MFNQRPMSLPELYEFFVGVLFDLAFLSLSASILAINPANAISGL